MTPESLKQSVFSLSPLSWLIWRGSPGLDDVELGLGPSNLLHGSGLMSQLPPLLSPQVEILPQGRESPIFKQFFKDWK